MISPTASEMATLNFETKYPDDEVYSLADKSLKFDSKTDIEPYLKELNLKKNVKKIDFSGNTIGIDASKSLAESVLLHKDTLEEVNFADLFTGRLKDEIPLSLQYLLPALNKAPKLRIVNLSDNAFGFSTIEPLEQYLSNAVYLEHLILSNNGMGPYSGEIIGKSLFKLSLAKEKLGLPSLRTFICGRNRLENGSTAFLSIGLKSHKDLEVVKLYQNGIRTQGISRLIKNGLRHNTKLTIIDLQDNTLTKDSAKDLAANLSSWKNLEELNVNDCLLNPTGSLALVKAFHTGKAFESLERLKLQYNELDQPALELLKDVIQHKLPKLKILELNGNRFEEENSVLESISAIFEERGFGELDELDDLEEIDSEEEEEGEEEYVEESSEEENDDEIDPHVLEQQLRKEHESYTEDDNDKEVNELVSKFEQSNI